MRSWVVTSTGSSKSCTCITHFSFPDFVHGSEGLVFYMISFLGARRDNPHHVKVLETRGEGSVSGVEGGGSGSEEC